MPQSHGGSGQVSELRGPHADLASLASTARWSQGFRVSLPSPVKWSGLCFLQRHRVRAQ